MEKFKIRSRIKSYRAIFWDYSNDGSYFITICLKNRIKWFGDVVQGEMRYSQMGEIALRYMAEIPLRFPFASVDSYVVMPDHIHLIISLRKDGVDSCKEKRFVKSTLLYRSPSHMLERVNNFSSERKESIQSNSKRDSPVIHLSDRDTPTQGRDVVPRNKNPMLSNHLAKAIRWYKGRVKFESRSICPQFEWQCRFYDIIIRNEIAYQRIKNYIKNNPRNWKKNHLSDVLLML